MQQDRKKALRILRLVQETATDPFGGIGKPEPLKHELAGCWSKRIDDEHRLVYQVEAQGEELPFGNNEGLAVYLNGTDLPDEVYAECDFDFVYSEFNRLLDTDGKVHSFWQGPTETALYAYGPTFEKMQNRLADFLASYPLCQRARVVQIA